MSKRKISTKKIALLGMFVAVAMIFSYIETFIPVSYAVPGIKLGLANMITIIVMYNMDVKSAWAVSVLRIILSSLLFGNLSLMAYSLAGGIISLTVMTIFHKIKFFKMAGVSILGAVSHNLGQIIVAAFVVKNKSVIFYIPPLIISGVAAGVCVGIAACLVAKKLPRIE
jgi:heptaprenyl diphosphate synthase